MNHILDNPIWHALNTGNSHLSDGNDMVRYFPSLITTFVGMKDFSAGNFQLLYDLFPGQTVRATFTPDLVPDPAPWELIGNMEILQMVYSEENAGATRSTERPEPAVTPLTLAHVPAMLQLTKLTNPGPFNTRTIEFGFFKGIFHNKELVAMAGQRLQAGEYAEVSAVCTHPSHTGNGYAGSLLRHQVKMIRDSNRIPVLHVKTDNAAAIRLYEAAGFRTRRPMRVIIFKKS